VGENRTKDLADMLTEYLHAALSQARYEILKEDGGFHGEIPGLQGLARLLRQAGIDRGDWEKL
jgi:hypothetical protein